MEPDSHDPLTVEAAKQRLRRATQGASPAVWVRKRPWDALALAFASGLLAGAEPVARKPLAMALAQLLSSTLVASAQDDLKKD